MRDVNLLRRVGIKMTSNDSWRSGIFDLGYPLQYSIGQTIIYPGPSEHEACLRGIERRKKCINYGHVSTSLCPKSDYPDTASLPTSQYHDLLVRSLFADLLPRHKVILVRQIIGSKQLRSHWS